MCNISLIIPLYNKEKYIVNALKSVYAQKENVNEVLIIDDGSTDNSLKIAQDFIENKKNFSIYSKKNEGVSAARNLGIQLAKYDYVAFLDADDEWGPDYILNISELIKKYKNAVAFSSSHYVNKPSGKKWNKTMLPENFQGVVEFYKYSKKLSILNSSKTVIKKDMLLSIGGFPEGVKNGEDLFVWMELARLGQIAHINKPLVTINQFHDDSRGNRALEVPYPIIYYSEHSGFVNNKVKKYLFKIALKYIIINKIHNNDILTILEKFKLIDKSGFYILNALSFIPNFILSKSFK